MGVEPLQAGDVRHVPILDVLLPTLREWRLRCPGKYVFPNTEGERDPEAAKADITQINVFPNPYYGVNTEELNKYQRFVIFNHLPRRATIRIFNLAGVQVRRIEKESDSQFERWDLANDSGLPVGSGLYLVHISMPELGGATKILKLAVVQEQQILDRF